MWGNARSGSAAQASDEDDKSGSTEDPLERGLGRAGEQAADDRRASGVGVGSGIRAEVDPSVEVVEALDLRVAIDRDRFQVADMLTRDLSSYPDRAAADGD